MKVGSLKRGAVVGALVLTVGCAMAQRGQAPTTMTPLFTIEDPAALHDSCDFHGDTIHHSFQVTDQRVSWTDCYTREDLRDYPNPWSGWGQVSLSASEACTVDVIITDSGGVPTIWHRYLQNPPGDLFSSAGLLSRRDVRCRYNVLIDHKLVAACDLHP